MPKEVFPIKKTGDGLSHGHVNDMGRVLTNLSGGNQGTGLQGTSGWITGVAGRLGPFSRLAKIWEETATDGVYSIRFRYWNESSSIWEDETDDYDMDARCFTYDAAAPQKGPTLVHNDQLSVRYDQQKGMWVPDQFLFPNSRWAWVGTLIAARSGATESSQLVKLVKQTMSVGGTTNTWTYLKDADDADINVRCFNGFPDAIPASVHARIGWNSLGQYEVKGIPCSEDAELA